MKILDGKKTLTRKNYSILVSRNGHSHTVNTLISYSTSSLLQYTSSNSNSVKALSIEVKVTHNALNVFVSAIGAVNAEQVIGVVERVEATMLSEHCDDSGACPVEALAE